MANKSDKIWRQGLLIQGITFKALDSQTLKMQLLVSELHIQQN